ncbi:MAG: hypothetical protein AB8B50_08500 [Pirellulaceae bacterium]
MKRFLALLALCGFMVGCGAEPATDQDAELDTMEEQYENPEAAEAGGSATTEEGSASN